MRSAWLAVVTEICRAWDVTRLMFGHRSSVESAVVDYAVAFEVVQVGQPEVDERQVEGAPLRVAAGLLPVLSPYCANTCVGCSACACWSPRPDAGHAAEIAARADGDVGA